MPERRPITSTYRLQLHAGFGFADAEAIVPYLAELGVSHVYLSPVLQAAPDSMHGYDVVDHAAVSTELGGRDGLTALARQAHDHDLGLVVDVVPNHMAVPTPLSLNRQLWSVLRDGNDSPFAHWFDLDWDLCGGRIGLPLLGETTFETLAAGQLTLGDREGEPVIRYHQQAFPVRPGTESGSTGEVLDRQHYLLASWRAKDEVLGYRRFFDVDTLIAVRVELPDVFEATHAVLLELYREGVVDGFRIDHPDGLADPEGYLDRLYEETDGAWVVVEKILTTGERLPASWRCAGTTGYDAIAALEAALAPPTGAQLDRLWTQVVADQPPEIGLPSFEETERRAKSDVITRLLQPEIRRLVRRAVEAARDRGLDLEPGGAQQAFQAMLMHVETYRAYLRLEVDPSDEADTRITTMADRARNDRPDLGEAIGVLVLLLLDTHTTSEPGRDLVVRFQQVCGPVMAKGVEDTTFYRWHRFVALNEVGGDPLSLDAPGPDRVHDWAGEQARTHPMGMTTLSTHDTKRDEDVRARLLAAGEQMTRWKDVWSAAQDLAVEHDIDAPTAYLLMQTLVGAWPIDERRLWPYAEKAVREAKLQTAWTDPDVAYEARVAAFVRATVADGPLARAVSTWVHELGEAAQAVRLSAKLTQLALPGVPDVYQGTELVQGFLVDPDNRRPVDFVRRTHLLTALDATRTSLPDASTCPSASVGANPGDRDPRDTAEDALKLWVVSRTLRLRRQRPELFGPDAGYRRLESTSDCAWGFVRGSALATLVQRCPSKLVEQGGFGDTIIAVPSGHWVDVLTGGRYTTSESAPHLPCAEVYAALPVALLVREET